MTTPNPDAASPHPSPATTAVIGAGIAGLTLASALQAAGQPVTVFEKSRGPGGRCSTRRTPGGGFDHGAPRFTAGSPDFAAQLATWRAQGWLGPEGEHGGVGLPSMNAVPQRLAEGIDLRCQVHIAALERDGDAWALRTLAGEVLPMRFDRVLVAVPAEQAAALLQPDAELSAAMQAVHSEPCWTVMAAWPGPLPVGVDEWQGNDPLAPLATARRDDTRPGRAEVPGVASRWVLHATAHWTRHNLDVPANEVARHLIGAWAAALGLHLARPVFGVAHRWLYAQVPDPRPEPFGWNAALGLGACGDAWHAAEGAPGLERAWLSARALAAAVGPAAT